MAMVRGEWREETRVEIVEWRVERREEKEEKMRG